MEVLSRELISTQESERRHLARELHDEIGQVFTAIKMNLRRTLKEADGDLQVRLTENVKMVDHGINQVRNLTLRLRPPQLDELGLTAALHWLVKHQALNGEFEANLDVDLDNTRISADLETVCFRITQEAITNVLRHAKPNNLQVKLWCQDDSLHLSVSDDGIGFQLSESRLRALQGGCVGLISMQERASLVGGVLQIESMPEKGTRIHASFPLSTTTIAQFTSASPGVRA